MARRSERGKAVLWSMIALGIALVLWAGYVYLLMPHR